MQPIFTHRLDVRFRDCDPMGHVNNAVYLTYLEQARFAHWNRTPSGALVASARTVLVTYDYGKGTPVPVSDEIRARLTMAAAGSG